jgi:hypothetical protein
MTNDSMSPAARAVCDAVLEICPAPADEIAAAVLRAVAGIIKRAEANSTTSTDWGDGWKHGVRETAQGLLAIAAELEGSHD